jgi:hypothetical protein
MLPLFYSLARRRLLYFETPVLQQQVSALKSELSWFVEQHVAVASQQDL